GALDERDGRGGRRAFRTGDAADADGDLPDLPRRVAELKDVAGVALDGEVFVQRADERIARIEDDAIVGDFGDRAARRDREQPRAAPRAHAPVDLVAMHERPAPTAPRRESLAGHRQ